GYNADLTITDVQMNSGSSPAFSSTSLPWTSVTMTTSDAEIEMPVDYAPVGTTGSANVGRYLFSSNDTFRPTAAVDLSAIVGSAQQCVLIANPDPADFGWVATDELSLCDSGQSLPPPFNNWGGSGECISRDLNFTLSNVGQLDCNGITLGDIIYNAGSEDKFALETDPSGGAAFDLATGAVSENFTLRFIADPTENAINYLAKLPYTVPDMLVTDNDLLIKAKGGGAPDCEITFQPITPPTLFCTEDQLAFGNVNIGQQRTVDLQLNNTGSDTCLVTNIGLTSGTDTASWSIPTPQADLTLAVNDSATIPVTFNSTAPSGNDPFTEIAFLCGTSGMGGGGFPGFPGMPGMTGNDNGMDMTITSQGSGTSEEKKIIFTAKATRPDIDVIPGEIDFGLVTVGCCSAEKTIRIYNGGDGTLTISPPVTVVSSDSGFTISQPSDMELAPGEYTEFTTRWCAGEEGPSTGIIEIHSTDDNEEFFTVPLSGEGTLDNQGDDAFQQPERPMVDVLWSVDDSGSMSDEQQDLANNFSSFISSAVSLNTDYHIGVVNTDSESDQSGHLYSCNSNLWITDTQSSSQQQSEFSCNVKTSNSGRPASDSKESPLQAMRLALDYPNIDGFNDGFYREEAKLYLIAVTDEEDQSDGTAQQYVDYFRNLKGLGNPDLLNISAIAGPPPNGCDTAGANQVDYDAVNMVGGEFRSICTADWSNIIEDLGLDVFNARRSFTLTRPAEPSTIVIEVCDDDGAGNPVNCQTVTDWTFDGNYNTVTFGDNAVPGPNQHIQVTYTAVCY
ncbi:MAG: choice-of-anchor D domain-containing protein, partial [Myxococcota bacterium]|nr:choice-of-anchor D domain-containing protein [Myxococcota bacterium]